MKSVLLLSFLLLSATLKAQTYAERLGFPKGKKVVILHVDDAGMSYEANQGTLKSMQNGIATSTSVMMPCAWVPQFMEQVQKNPSLDVGVHLTMTSEWNPYRWFPLVGKDKAPGLYDEQGGFWHSVAQVVEHAKPDEVEAEMRAQIARYRQFGVQPTHLDSHMGTLFEMPFLPRYVKVGIEEKIPILFPGGHATLISSINRVPEALRPMLKQIGEQLWNAGLPVLDDLDGTSYSWKMPAGTPVTDESLQKFKTQKFIELLQSCKPGITYIIMHSADAGAHFDQISNSGQTRRGDMLAMLDPALKAYIQKEGIILTTWRELSERRKKVQ
ncbi:polysaccharide deacetylase family protein [Tellurirhabdus rosea]|uniref:polysaccharide deacetylase family protein n=1 Tax=Tellurirhabdus rosea TaxID=2674997 RepID=UPI00224F12D3|nr:polysaccharide deacetylase family protein [Tellurirhabdus rosea]